MSGLIKMTAGANAAQPVSKKHGMQGGVPMHARYARSETGAMKSRRGDTGEGRRSSYLLLCSGY
jgi:hypothetical protein